MTEPWKNGYLKSQPLSDPLDNPVLQRDCARELASLLEERNEKALRLHHADTLGGALCWECGAAFPCSTRRLLTGADEDGNA